MERVPLRPGKAVIGLIGLLLGCVSVSGRTAAPKAPEPAVAAAPAAAPVVPNSECMDCHEAEFKSRMKGLSRKWIGGA